MILTTQEEKRPKRSDSWEACPTVYKTLWPKLHQRQLLFYFKGVVVLLKMTTIFYMYSFNLQWYILERPRQFCEKFPDVNTFW